MVSKEELEKELVIYKDRLEKAMEAGNLAWWEMELPSGQVDFNDRKAKMLGYSLENFSHYTDFTDLIHPEDHDKAMKAMKDHLKGEKERYEVEYRIKKKNGEYKWFRDVGGITEENKEKGYQKVSGIVIDIDNRKEVEERERFLHSLLRHDIQNKNQVIEGYLKLLKEKPEKTKKYVKKALEATKESEDIIEKVRKLREVNKEKIGKVRIKPILREVIEENKLRAKEKNIEIIYDLNSKSKVLAGPLLKELFKNLIENSINHSEGEKIIIEIKEGESEIICSIEDDGKGIPDDVKQKIFERGFKYGETGKTGLGLYLVKEIAKKYDLKVEVKDSELGGAQFKVHLQKAC